METIRIRDGEKSDPEAGINIPDLTGEVKVVIGGSFSLGFPKLLAGFCNQKHGMWDFVPELTITSPYVNSNTFTMGTRQSYARVNSIPQSGTQVWPMKMGIREIVRTVQGIS
jgi:hypothetical protein